MNAPDPYHRGQDIHHVVAALADLSAQPGRTHLHALSNLEGDDLAHFDSNWPRIDAARRRQVMEALSEIAAERFDLVFRQVARVAMNDEDGLVRAAAIDILVVEEDSTLIPPLLTAMKSDSFAGARGAAAKCLGVYMYLGEIEELPAARREEIADALLEAESGDEETHVRRRALEALGYSSRREVAERIQIGWNTSDDGWQASAVRAMGRSADPARWGAQVVDALTHASESVRVEAARASGELGIKEAAPELAEMIYGSRALQQAAIWALGEIGGSQARSALIELQAVAEHDDEAQTLVEEALSNIDLMRGELGLGIVDPDELAGLIEDEDTWH